MFARLHFTLSGFVKSRNMRFTGKKLAYMKNLEELISLFFKLSTGLQVAWGVYVCAVIVIGIALFVLSANFLKGLPKEKVPPPPPPNTETVQITVGNHIFTIVSVTSPVIVDTAGKSAKFKISILSRECHWKYESTTEVLLNDKPVDMVQFFLSPGMQADFDTVRDVIVIGTASEQGKIKIENKRSDERAEQLIHWLRQAVKQPSINFYTLSLGKFQGAEALNKEESAYQRSIVLVGVIERDENVNLNHALKQALEKTSLPFTLSKYSKYPEFQLVHVGGSRVLDQ